MKKSILAVAVVLGSTTLFAQNLESKNGEAYLPAAGDWAIGVDATPFLNYAGNLIGGGQGNNNAPTWNFLTTNQTITGKYFVEDDMAYRASLRLGFGSATERAMVGDRAVTTAADYPALPAMVENTMKTGGMNIGIGVGLEKRRGFGRLQGFYGAELGINMMSSSEKYTYGNELTVLSAATPVNVTAADDFGTNVFADPDYGFASRVTERKSGMGFGIGIRGFIGAEYFVLPRLAVGGEFGWGLAFMSQGASTTTTEMSGVNSGGNESVEVITREGSKSSMFGVDTDNINSVFGPAGSLRMTFHF